jgi:hypothetical protein
MPKYGRRELLTATAVAVGTALAGCSDGDEPEPGLHAVSVVVFARQGDPDYDATTDRLVRVTVENTDIDRHRGSLVVTARPTEGATATEPLRQEQSIDLAGGTTRGYEFVFRDVAGETDQQVDVTASIGDG